VESFFRRYYVPNNAVLAIAGDVDVAAVEPMVRRLFGWIPRGTDVERPDVQMPGLESTRYITLEDRVTLPQINLLWRTPPAYAEDDAALNALGELLTGGKNSRLFRRLVYDEQVAQDVSAFNWSKLLSGDFYLRITGREGVDLRSLEAAAMEEIRRVAEEAPEAGELARVVNGIETDFVRSLETNLGRADRLNAYLYFTGEPNFAPQDLERYRALTPEDLQRAARMYLADEHRVVISIVPTGRTDLAPAPTEEN
jgi:zinc protease